MRIITLPYPDNREIAILKDLLNSLDVWVHLRKPTLPIDDLRKYLQQFTAVERSRMLLHQHAALAVEYDMPHIHHTAQQRRDWSKTAGLNSARVIASTSTHSWADFNGLPACYRAAFISPVFPSISKSGYGADEQIPLLGRSNMRTEAVALGGISSRSIPDLEGSDFQDFALCGAFWQAAHPLVEAKRCQEIFKLFRKTRA